MINKNNIKEVTVKKEGFIKKTFGIIPKKEVEVIIPENLDFLESKKKISNYKSLYLP